MESDLLEYFATLYNQLIISALSIILNKKINILVRLFLIPRVGIAVVMEECPRSSGFLLLYVVETIKAF